MVILGDCGSLDSGSNLGPGPHFYNPMVLYTTLASTILDTMSRTRDHLDMFRRLCVECGACREVCPSYRHGGCDPLAVMQGNNSRVFDCMGCGNCSRACEHTDPKTVMLAAYSIMLNRPVSQAFLDTGLARYPEEDAPGSDLEPVWTGDDVYVMPGCTAKCAVPYIVYAASAMMKAISEKASELPGFTCCMYPIQFGVMEDEERESYRRRMGETATGKEMVTLCAGCSEIMQRSRVKCEHVIPFLHSRLERLPRVSRPIRVSLEPGCAAIEFRDMMTEVAEAMGCVPIGNEPGCCGKNSRKVSGPLMSERQAAAADAELIVVGCPMCQDKYDAVTGGKPVVHITELVAAAAGDRSSLTFHRIPVPDF